MVCGMPHSPWEPEANLHWVSPPSNRNSDVEWCAFNGWACETSYIQSLADKALRGEEVVVKDQYEYDLLMKEIERRGR